MHKCQNCGNERSDKSPYLIAETVLRYAPLILFGLFAALIFAFFAAPLMTAELFGFRESESFYEALRANDVNTLHASLWTLVVIGMICVITTAVWALTECTVNRRKHPIKPETEKLVMTLTASLLQLAALITACVVIGKINKQDGGLGILSTGACPILIIVFCVVFALLELGSLFGRKILLKRFPEIAEENARIKDQKAADKKARLEARKRALGEPKRPDCVKARKPDLAPEAKKIQRFMRFKRAYPFLTAVCCICGAALTGALRVNSYTGFLLVICAGIFAVLVTASLGFLLQRSYYAAKFTEKNASRKSVYAYLIITLVIFLVGYFINRQTNPMRHHFYPNNATNSASAVSGNFDLSCLSYGLILFAYLSFILIAVLGCYINHIRKRFYDKKTKKLKICFEESNADTVRYLEECKTYKINKKKNWLPAEIYDWQTSRYNRGLSYDRTPSTVALMLRAKRYVLVVLSVFLAATTIFWSVAGTAGTDIFTLARINALSGNMALARNTGKKGIEYYLGKADIESENNLIYLSDNYLSVAKQIQANTDKLLTAKTEAEIEAILIKDIALNNKLNGMTYRYISVSLSADKVTSVLYDAKCCNSALTSVKWDEANTGKIKLSYDVPYFESGFEIRNITAKIYYTDGSYQYTTLPDSTAVPVDPTAGVYRFIWSDAWGSYAVTEYIY